jgi:hypothetical protein
MHHSAILRTLFAVLLAGVIAVGCSNVNEPTNSVEPKNSTNSKQTGSIAATGPGFTFTLISSNVFDQAENGGLGGYVWEWEVVTNDDQEDPLNHVVVQLGSCVDVTHLIAGYNFNSNSEHWNSFQLHFGDDNSMGCDNSYAPERLLYVPSVGSPVGYFRLVFDRPDYAPQPGVAFWKSTNNCSETSFLGVGCVSSDDDGGGQGDDEGCSYSQGYYFASPVSAYPNYPGWGGINDGEVMIGGHVYTEGEARNIFRSSNKGGIADAKSAFQQAVAIKLSGSYVFSVDVWGWVAEIDAYLSNYAKLTPNNVSGKNRPAWVWNANIKTAAGNIGAWIDEHHCEDQPVIVP